MNRVVERSIRIIEPAGSIAKVKLRTAFECRAAKLVLVSAGLFRSCGTEVPPCTYRLDEQGPSAGSAERGTKHAEPDVPRSFAKPHFIFEYVIQTHSRGNGGWVGGGAGCFAGLWNGDYLVL